MELDAQAARVASHLDLAFDARDRVAADPDIFADLVDMDATGASKSGALACDVAIWRNAGSDQPLSEAGIEAPCDRVLSRPGGDEAALDAMLAANLDA
jgi:hypothetical protein